MIVFEIDQKPQKIINSLGERSCPGLPYGSNDNKLFYLKFTEQMIQEIGFVVDLKRDKY